MWREELQTPETGVVSQCRHAGPSHADKHSTVERNKQEPNRGCSLTPPFHVCAHGRRPVLLRWCDFAPSPRPVHSKHKANLQPGQFPGKGQGPRWPLGVFVQTGKGRPFLWAAEPHGHPCPGSSTLCPHLYAPLLPSQLCLSCLSFWLIPLNKGYF